MISEPRLLLDEAKARRNLARMAARAQRAGVRLRPHFKTHQSQEIGRWFRDYGVEAITVSSLSMAEYFAADGWHDITLAFPFHRGMHARAEALLRSGVKLGILLADFGALDGVRFEAPIDTWLKIDVGTHRTGFEPEDLPELRSYVTALRQRSDIQLRGLLAHAGHSYAARGIAQIGEVHRSSLAILHAMREGLAEAAGPLALSVGDTPTCSTQDDWPGVEEIRPGNFIFYDLSQWQIGSCSIEDIAVAMECPVVSRHPRRGELVVHGGAVHFSKDWIELDGERVYGIAVEPKPHGWGGLLTQVVLARLSQEHGVALAGKDTLGRLAPGTVLRFLPVHSCLAADAMGGLTSLGGRQVATRTGLGMA